MSSIVISGDTSGTVSLTVPALAGTNTATLPAATGTVMVSGNMPAFSAYANANQSVTTNTWTKVSLQVEEYDTANCFDSTTNYRFTPNVAGYYLVTCSLRITGTVITNTRSAIYKNGTEYRRVQDFTSAVSEVTGSTQVYCNGTTDYLEFYGFITATSPAFLYDGIPYTSLFQACLVRSA